jgi:hypothetical protein
MYGKAIDMLFDKDFEIKELLESLIDEVKDSKNPSEKTLCVLEKHMEKNSFVAEYLIEYYKKNSR